jgi:flagellar biosynthesis protein FlhG
MIRDQADDLRQLVRQRALMAGQGGPLVPLLVVAGGKGGVGTTTIAANLAVALARQGRRSLFVDCDLDHGGNAALGQHPERGSVVDVLAGRRTVHEVLERGPSGIQVLSGAWASGELVDCSAAAQQRFVDDIQSLGPHVEVAVVDAGSSRSPLARRLWTSAAATLVVTTSEASAIMESYAAIKVLLAGQSQNNVYTFVNREDTAETAGEVHARIAEACRKFLGLQAVGAGHVSTAERNGAQESVLIFSPRGDAARALDRVADALWAQLQLAAPRTLEPRRSA